MESGLSFELALRAQVQLARVGFLRRRNFREQVELLDRFLAQLGISDPARIESARREQCLASWIRHTRKHWVKVSRARQSVWLHLASDVEATLRGGALLVGTHFGCGLLTPLALARLEIPILVIVRKPGGPSLSPRLFEIIDISRESTLRAVAEARATLRGGGVVFLAGDLVSGSRDGDIEVNVLGRKRRISRGFAELSLASSVPATPILSRIDQAGNIITWLEPALRPSGETHKARVASLAGSYARQISTTFAQYPGNVSPPSIRNYLDSPRVDHDGAGLHELAEPA